MNYYEHHLGDYAEATAHLSFVEDAAYSRLMRKCYSTELPLPADVKAVQRLIGARTKEERQAVEDVLGEFFELREDGWHNARCDAEIARYQDKQAKAKRSAEARWSAQRPQSDGNANADASAPPNAMRTQSEGNALQTPDTRHQTPIPPNPRKRGPGVHGFPPGFEVFWSAYPRKVAKSEAAKAYARLRPDDATQAVLLASLARQAESPEWRKDSGRFIPHPTTWLNGRRWEDEGDSPSGGDIFAGAR